MLANQFQFNPAPASSSPAVLAYISKNVALDKDAVEKAVINADDDTFQLDERLLTLGVIWRWRSQKRLEYAEDLKTFEIALSEEIGTDKGPRILAVGRPSFPGNVRTAYPGALGQ